MINQNKKLLKIKKKMNGGNFNNDAFIEGLNSAGPQNIYNCLSNLETKVKEIFDLAKMTKESKIKGAGHLLKIKFREI